MTPSLEFDWWRAGAGYELAERQGVPMIRAKGEARRVYQPLTEFPALFRDFADVPSNGAAMLEFVGRYGLLDSSPDPNLRPVSAMSVASILERRRHLRRLIAGLDNQRESFRVIVGGLIESIPGALFRLTMDIQQSPPALELRPVSLFAAMVWQLANEIAGIVTFRRCRQCATWIPFIAGRGGTLRGGLKTQRRLYCSDRCRVAYNRTQNPRSKGLRP